MTKSILWFLGALWLSSCVSPTVNEAPREPASSGHKIEMLTFKKTVDIAANSASVESALQKISRQYNAYLSYYTLMYGSQSLHESSFLEPRAIVFGPSANYVLTFNGHAGQKAGNTFETMEYDPTTGQFLFREIAFKKQAAEQNDPMLKESDIAFANENIRVSKANPQKCLICHGPIAHPRWETYFTWPGAYGSEDDILTSMFYKGESTSGVYSSLVNSGIPAGSSFGRAVKLAPGITDKESEGFREFMRRKPQHKRFSLLPDRAIDTAITRWLRGENPQQIDTTAAVDAEARKIPTSLFHTRPNLDLSEKLNQLVLQSFVTRMASTPQTASLPFKMAWIQKCSAFKDPVIYGPALQATKNLFLMELHDPLPDLQSVLSNAEITKIRQVAGEWKNFFRQFMSDELDMEVDKYKRIEELIGFNALEVSNKTSYSNAISRPLGYYRILRKRELNRYEKLIELDSYDDFYKEALLAYVAKGAGVNLGDYATNFHRVATFRDGGLQNLQAMLIRADLLQQEDTQDQLCQQLKTKTQ